MFRKFIKILFPSFRLHNYRTVHFAFSLLFIFAGFMGMASVVSKNSSYVKIITSATQIETGSKFSVDVFAYADIPVNTIDIAISFPEKSVMVLGIDRGESVVTLWTRDPYVEGGTVFLQGGTYRKGFVGEHKIATINLRALAPGKAEFVVANMQLLAGNGKGTAVAVNDHYANTSAYIYDTGTIANVIKVDTAGLLVTDVDGDGKVTFSDISIFMVGWFNNQKYDFNGDGLMTLKDFSLLLTSFFTQK